VGFGFRELGLTLSLAACSSNIDCAAVNCGAPGIRIDYRAYASDHPDAIAVACASEDTSHCARSVRLRDSSSGFFPVAVETPTTLVITISSPGHLAPTRILTKRATVRPGKCCTLNPEIVVERNGTTSVKPGE
jgi:hypothetical protein